MELYLKPLKVFISYSHRNADDKNEIVRYLLKSGSQFEILSDEMLNAADDWNEVLKRLRDEADVFLLLVSAAYVASETVHEHELEQILKRGASHAAYVIPVILEDCNWNKMPYAIYQAVPKFAKAISTFKNRQEAYLQIIYALNAIHNLLLNNLAIDIIKKCQAEKIPVLHLSGCSLHDIPHDLLYMDWLRQVHLQNNAIRKIEHLENLSNLEYLDLSNNEIAEIENLDNLKKLTYLDFERNRLTKIKNIEKNVNLTTLGFSSNNVESLSGVTHLTGLQTLYAARNKITDISALSQMLNLKRIVLTDNLITSIRPLLPLINTGINVELKYALKAEELGIFIKGNSVSDPPVEVISMGTAAIIDHFIKSEQHGDKKLEILKLILVGNSGVGKTNFSELLRKKKINKNHISTDTLSIHCWKAPFLKSETGNAMLVNIFDFGGQDYYHDLHRLYYSHDTAYVLLWDTSTNAYAERTEKLNDRTELIYEDFPLEYWLESIQYNLYGKEVFDFSQAEHINSSTIINVLSNQTKTEQAAMPEKAVVKSDLSATAPVLVLQNKIDLGEGLLNQASLRQKYPNITTFFNMSINERKRTRILYEVLDSCLSKLNLSGRKLISYQHEVIEKYLLSNVDFAVLTLEEFKNKCAALAPQHKDKIDISDAKTIACILTNIGIVYFDQPAPGSNDNGIVFTRIGELSDLIKKIMNEAKLGEHKGIFDHKQVSGFQYIDHVLHLLAKNSSIIPLDDEAYLVPQFLPVIAGHHAASFAKAFVHCQIRYVYTAYFHKSILMSLFAKFLGKQNTQSPKPDLIKAVSYWRNGLILSQETAERPQMVFINFIKETDACRIEIRTLYPFARTGLEREIEKELDELNKGWSFCKEVSINSKDFFEVNAMIEQAKKKDFIFRGTNQIFTVNDFKDLVSFEKIPRKLFISYSSKNSEFVQRFWIHLNGLKNAGYIEPWYDRKIEAGTKWDDSIQKEMSSSHLVIFLLSPDFLNTDYIMQTEVKNAMAMEAGQQCELFFIQLLPCSWEDTDLKKYQMMFDPNQADKKQFFINTPGNDEAWKIITNVLRDKVKN